MALQQEILALLQAASRTGLKSRDIAQALSLRGKAAKSLHGQLRALVERGEITYSSSQGYRIGADGDTAMQGVVSGARSGAGFVKLPGQDEDVMIMQRDLGAALPGDTVVVRMNPQRKGDVRKTGRVVRIAERGTRDIVGTLVKTGAFHTVIPLNPIYKHSFHVNDPKDAVEGDRVVLRFSSWSNPQLNPEGEIVDVIGPADKPSLDTEAVVREFELPRRFPPAVLAEAEQVAARVSKPGKREDLRGKFTLTIDPSTARDFDDAISFEVDENGQRVLGVHIADVSHFVLPGSALDREARKRGTSVYLVDKVIPMLPEQLSNGVCSLRPGEDRLTLSTFLTFDEHGRVTARRFCRSRIRSRLRLSYAEALAIIEGRSPEGGGKKIPTEAKHLISEVHKLAQQLRATRFRRFALDISVPETQIVIDAQGRMTGVRATQYDVSNELIEECMVAANEAVATELANHRIPYISRLHDDPDELKLEELATNLAELGITAGNLTIPRNLANLITKLHDHPLRFYANMMVLRSMKRAEYNADKQGHFGLAKKFYSHFTAPIRRYPDLIAHRQLVIMLEDGMKGQPALNLLRDIAESSTETEFRAEQASRELIEIKKYRFLEEQLASGKDVEFDAVVIKVQEFGMFVEVVDLQVSGMVHVSAISDSYVRYNSANQTLGDRSQRFGAGTNVRVEVIGVNFNERKIDFRLVPTSKK